MEKRQLGKTDLYVAPLTLGGNVFGWTVNEERSFEILNAFTASGFNFIDTADSYSRWVPGNKGGESETIIGNWMRKEGNRKDIILSAKVGSDMGQGHPDVSKPYILEAVEKSLKRLKTDYIDLYQTHFDNEKTPVAETLGAYDQLVKQGKVRWIGTSNMSPGRIIDSLAVSKKQGYPVYQSLQPEYNLYEREKFETEYEPLCRASHMGVIGYFSLASGFLTGKYRSEADLEKSARGGGMKKYMNERGFRILAALDKVAAGHHSNPAAVSLAWLMARPSVTAPIASATSTDQLEALTTATALTLSKEDMSLLNEASSW